MKRLFYGMTIGGILSALLLCGVANAQESVDYKRLPDGRYVSVTDKSQKVQQAPIEEEISMGLSLGLAVPDGIAAQVAVSFMPQLTIRAGIGFFPKVGLYKKTFDLGDPAQMQSYQNALGYTPSLDASVAYSNLNGQAILDWHPMGKSFRISAGVYLGAPKVYTHAMMINADTGESIMKQESVLDPNNMPRIIISDANDATQSISIQPASDASLDATIALGRSVRPYLGIGFGKMAPHDKPVSFFIDLGVLLTGKVRLSSPNVIEGNPNILLDFDPQVQNIVYKAQFLPVFNVGVAIRLGRFAL